MIDIHQIDIAELCRKNGLWYYTEVRSMDGTYLILYRWDDKLSRKFNVMEFLIN